MLSTTFRMLYLDAPINHRDEACLPGPAGGFRVDYPLLEPDGLRTCRYCFVDNGIDELGTAEHVHYLGRVGKFREAGVSLLSQHLRLVGIDGYYLVAVALHIGGHRETGPHRVRG